jgi:hypothetical protein
MKRILDTRIIRHLIREEAETKARYVALGKKYGIPSLVRAGKQEGQHSKMFKRIQEMPRFERREK